jgi:hypothetical protein
MPPITALLHTENDALRLGRCLETLYPCDEIVIIDHGSRDGTVQVAREYGARVVAAGPGASSDQHPRFAAAGWILTLDPHESLTESLAASLFEWKVEWKAEWKTQWKTGNNDAHNDAPPGPTFSVFLREETSAGWVEIPTAQTRLVPQTWNRWNGRFPVHEPSARALEGELLRFVFP